MKKLLTLVGAATLAAGSAVAAEIEANVALATDYSFRGWSQTQRDPALQGGFDIAFESGFYVGTWGSNVNFGPGSDLAYTPSTYEPPADDPDADPVYTAETVAFAPGDVASMEWDLYFGWGTEISEGVAIDVSFIHFEYPGNREALNYQELAGSVAIGDVTVGINYSPEYLAVADVTFIYPYVDYSMGLTEDLSLDLHLGFNMADSPTEDFFGDSDEYLDYSASVSMPLMGASVSIGLYGTDNDACGRDCEVRPILSLSKSL